MVETPASSLQIWIHEGKLSRDRITAEWEANASI